jgi:hypothetical protein
MSQREARLSRSIANTLKKEFPGLFVFKVWGSEHQMAGLPDLLGCYQGFFFGFEVKLPESRENVSERQKLTHSWIRQGGGFVAVVCSPHEAVEALRDLLSAKS